jgi:hypothetical protein
MVALTGVPFATLRSETVAPDWARPDIGTMAGPLRELYCPRLFGT